MKIYKKFILKDDQSFDTCIKKLDANLNLNYPKLIIIINKMNKVLGTVTDGDIRRGLLKKIELKDNVKKIMKKYPKLIRINNLKKDIQKYKNFDLPIPIIDKKGVIIDLEIKSENYKPNQYDNTVIIMAGGFGKRLKPLTNYIPKPMVKIDNTPILEIIINKFKKFGFNNFKITTHYKGNAIKNYFGNGKKLDVKIEYIEEKHPLGTVGVLKKIKKNQIVFPFILMNADILTKVDFASLLDFHNESKSEITICTKQYKLNVPYGVIQETNRNVKAFIEKPNYIFNVNAGIYVLSKEIFNKLDNNKFLNMDTFLKKIISKKIKIKSYPLHEYWIDIGKIEDFKKAQMDISSGIF